ncbi:MAG TPA: hypothetical protein VMU21_02535 [Thermodesulfovibrionales bacterium]|nr:hypothetical protein [Thermodesulfovibrionales bacterium]
MTRMFSRSSIAIAIVLLLSILIIPVFMMQRASKKEVDTLKSKRNELAILTSEFTALKGQVDVVEQKTTSAQVQGVANVLDGIVSSIGIKGKLKSVKGLGSREIKGPMTEESAEVQLERVSMNELVNMFYRIREAPVILSVKRATMKKAFENPDFLDVTMTIALFTKK